MANFSPTKFDFGSQIQRRREAETAKGQAEAQAFAESLKEGHDNTVARIGELREAAGEIVTRGGTDEQIETARNAIFALAKSFGDRLDQGSAFAAQIGRGSEVPLGAGEQFVDAQMQLFETSIEAAGLSTPSAEGAQNAESVLAEAKGIAEATGKSIESVLQGMDVLPANKTPVAAVGPGGETGFFREDAEGFEPIPGAQPIPSGLDVEITPEGGVRITTGTKSKLQKPTQARLEKSILDSQEGIARLQGIQVSFDPKFLTFGGKFENFKLSTLEKIDPESLSPDEAKFLTDYSTFTANAIDNINRYIKEITGAQMSEPEAVRIRKGVPDPESDGPTVFKAKMEANIRQLFLARARAIHVRNQGLDKEPWDAFSLSQMEGVIEQRVDQLTSHFASQGGDGKEAKRAAVEQAAKEFGFL